MTAGADGAIITWDFGDWSADLSQRPVLPDQMCASSSMSAPSRSKQSDGTLAGGRRRAGGVGGTRVPDRGTSTDRAGVGGALGGSAVRPGMPRMTSAAASRRPLSTVDRLLAGPASSVRRSDASGRCCQRGGDRRPPSCEGPGPCAPCAAPTERRPHRRAWTRPRHPRVGRAGTHRGPAVGCGDRRACGVATEPEQIPLPAWVDDPRRPRLGRSRSELRPASLDPRTFIQHF